MNRPCKENNEARSIRNISEAADWRLAALLLERPHGGWREEIDSLYPEVEYSPLKVAATNSREASEGAYLRILGPGGHISPRAIAYRQREDPGQILADIAGIYQAFSFSPRTEDPIDHICTEANFAGFLCLKEAHALAEDNLDAAHTVALGLQRFLTDHLQPFASALSQKLQSLEPLYLDESARCLLNLAQRRIENKLS